MGGTKCGTVVGMSLTLTAVTFDAHEPERLAAFWAALLDRRAERHADGVLLPGTPTQVGLRFAPTDAPQEGPHRLHLHLTTEDADDEAATVRRVLEFGGRHLDVGQLPEENHTVLADPEGNPLCVIGPGNSFLAGCGPLGEVGCEGTREVGLFWAEALGWPLVWNQDEETAVQAPAGGTKVAWGGPPVAPKHGRNRQRFDLHADDLYAEIARLGDLGARPLTHQSGYVELADSDGNEFIVRG